MVYRFAQERLDYHDFAAGTVFHASPGHPAFPVRLTSEIFQRCMDIRKREGLTGRCSVYDPCCGGGYLLASLAFLHWADIQTIYASDADPRILETARRNLNLLNPDGLQQRIEQIESMIGQFDKLSHREAHQSAHRLKAHLLKDYKSHSIAVHTFTANVITDTLTDDVATPIDMVITDIPYGNRSEWSGLPHDAIHEPAWYLLQSLLNILPIHAVVAIASNKQQKIAHERYQRIEHFQIGKRRVVILKPIGLPT
jgi:23S rRNA G2445 N2-methylase RlmL